MTTTRDELAAALVDVRNAYRLLHAYHRRLNDLFQTVSETVGNRGLELESWWSRNVARLPRTDKAFFAPEKWAWDLTPAYQIHADWSTQAPNGRMYRIGMTAVADTGYDDTLSDGEPDPAQFKAAADCRTELSISAWQSDAGEPDWREAVERVKDVPGLYDGKLHHVTVGTGLYSRQQIGTVDVAQLVSREAVQALVLAPIEGWLEAEGIARRARAPR